MGASQVIGIPLRWNDVDAYRHVSHMALVAILDDGRGRWLDSIVGSLVPDWGMSSPGSRWTSGPRPHLANGCSSARSRWSTSARRASDCRSG